MVVRAFLLLFRIKKGKPKDGNRKKLARQSMNGGMNGFDVPLQNPSRSDTASLLSHRQSLTSRSFVGLLIASVALGVVCIVSSLVGLHVWLQADYFTDPGPYAQNSWCGYDKRTFVGLLAFTALPTVGFTLLYVALQTALRSNMTWFTTTAFLFLAFACLNIGAVGMIWGNETMKCLGVFCVNMQKYSEVPNARPEAGIGFLSMVGISAFASLIPTSLVMLWSAAARVVSYRKQQGEQQQHTATPMSATKATFLAALATFIVLGLFGVATLYIPNSWEYFVAARIAKNAKLVIVTDANVCNTYYNQYTCSELPWANMKTANWQVSENLDLKLYPSNLIFYGYLLTLLAFVAFVRLNRAGRLFLKKHAAVGLSVGELSLTLFTVLMAGLFFSYWVHDHNYNGYWAGGDVSGITRPELWARSTGQLAVIFMSLLFFPASRNSVMHKIFGTSWEASLWAHRVLGYCMLGATFAHMVAWWRFFDIQGFFPIDIMSVPMETPTSIDNFTVPLSTLAAWILFLCMGVFALDKVRRRFFELFYYSHIIAAYFAIPVVLWHAAAGWEYLLPGITVWFIDRVVRLHRSGAVVTLVSARVYNQTTELRFLQPTMKASPGQYVFVNIPEISLFQWHPFTLSTGAHSKEFTLHIKGMGDGTWTKQLNDLVASGTFDLSLAVDGPYGSPFDPQEYKKVILVAGGIGITPCASIYSFLKDSEDDGVSVTLLWALREEEMAAAFTQHLERRPDTAAALNGSLPSPPQSMAKIFLTRSQGAAAVLAGINGVSVYSSRPQFDVEIEAAASRFEANDVVVFVCGPDAMVAAARSVAITNGFNFHAETFLL